MKYAAEICLFVLCLLGFLLALINPFCQGTKYNSWLFLVAMVTDRYHLSFMVHGEVCHAAHKLLASAS